MKKYLKKRVIAAIAFVVLIASCSKDDEPKAEPKSDPEVVLSSEKQLTSFVFLLTNNAIDDNVVGVIDEETKTITATMPPGTNITGLLPEIEISANAVVNPNTAQDFTDPIAYIVTAEDGSEAVYTATITKSLTQKEVLQAILDVNPNNTLNWDLTNTADIDLGTLDGVTTDIDGIIIELPMSDRNLTEVPAELGQLVNLTFLNFYKNSITTIPVEIGNLVNLEYLDFSANKLTSIPSEIGNLVNLIELYLNYNALETIPIEIGNLVNLWELDLNDNELTTIPTEIGNLTNLTSLYLGGNNLTSIPSEIGNLTNLINLALSSNNLTSIPTEIGNLTDLTYLNLGENKLATLPPEIGFLSNLRLFYINDNSITSIPKPICNLEDFIPTMIFEKDANAVCKTVSQKDALISIYSANPNNTLGWGVDNFPGVTFNTEGNPTVLTMHKKKLKRFPDNINFLKDLEVIGANNNQLTTVPSELSQLSKLVLLTLENNPLASIPQSVCEQQVINGGVLTILTDFGESCN